MREILFRGQARRKGERVRIGNGKPIGSRWVYGGIFPNNDGGDFAIIYQQELEIEKFPVYADTVCEYAGVPDRNKEKIFEGDIVREPFTQCVGVDKFGEYHTTANMDWQDGGHMGFYVDWHEGGLGERRRDIVFWAHKVEVVGNIFDDPELLEKRN